MTDHGFGLAPDDRIREFRIEKELGAGGFGVTYLAWDEELERWVALKEYLPREWGTRRSDGTVGPSFSTDAHYFQWGLAKFLEEARTLARLNHPQIVRVYQVIEARGTAYMAMEYVEGRSLKRELESVGRLEEARVREMLDALMSGLAAVHARGILHRDLKPANVMLGGADGLPVLIDFGAARQNMSRESRSLMSALTPPYAPVEQYETDGDQGPWTDIYALGVLTYECLSGERPAESVSRFRNDTTRPLTDVAPAVSPQLAALVEMALKVDERDRPQDVASWRRMLVEDALPSPSPEPSWSEPVVAGPPARDSSPSLAGDVSQPARDSSPSLAGRESQPARDSPGSLVGEESQPGGDSSGRLSQPAGDSSERSLAGEEFHPGRDSEDGQLSGDPSQSVPSLPGAGAERKPRWAVLAVGVGVAVAAGGGLWFAIGSSAGGARTMAGQDGMSETGNGGGLAAPALGGSGLASSAGSEEDDGTVSEMASTPPSREVDPPQEPSPLDPSPAEGAGPPPAESNPVPPEAVNPSPEEVSPLPGTENPPAEEVIPSPPEAESTPPETVTPPQPEEVTPPAAAEDDPGPILPAPGTTFQDCTPGEACAFPMMVVVPPPGRAGTVPTDPLAVSVHEVTVEQWRACAQDANSCDPRVLDREGNVHPDGTGFPVVAVTWDDAQAYVAWLNRRTSQPYRLLSEAEWEHMARAGTQTGRYWDNQTELCRYANAWDITAHNSIDNSTRAFADCEDSYASTAPVGSFTANSFGVHDALGNVEEWVQDGVVRGGSWRDGPEQLGAERRSELRTVRSSYVGFRVARTLN